MYDLIRENVSTQEIARSTMPGTILDVDYIVGHDVSGGWLDQQAVLTMDISMVVEQDSLAQQNVKPDRAQRQLIQDYSKKKAQPRASAHSSSG